MNRDIVLTVLPEWEGMRVDRMLADALGDHSRSFLQKLLEQGKVTVEGKALKKQDKVNAGVLIHVAIPEPTCPEAKPEKIPLDIVYEDTDLLVVNKPKGMVVHPAPGHATGTLVSALLYHCHGSLSGINGVERPGIVHRIDKDTSGLLMVAKTDAAHKSLAAQIQAHTFKRVYQAVAYGHFVESFGLINQPIGRSQKDRKKMCVTHNHAKEAITHYRVLEEYAQFSNLELELETGRTHQIRVHMAFLGHPLAGDVVYGPKRCITWLQGQCLHAKTLGFVHPSTGKTLLFDSPLPQYFTAFLEKCKKE